MEGPGHGISSGVVRQAQARSGLDLAVRLRREAHPAELTRWKGGPCRVPKVLVSAGLILRFCGQKRGPVMRRLRNDKRPCQ